MCKSLRYIEDANDMDRGVFTRIVFARGVVGSEMGGRKGGGCVFRYTRLNG